MREAGRAADGPVRRIKRNRYIGGQDGGAPTTEVDWNAQLAEILREAADGREALQGIHSRPADVMAFLQAEAQADGPERQSMWGELVRLLHAGAMQEEVAKLMAEPSSSDTYASKVARLSNIYGVFQQRCQHVVQQMVREFCVFSHERSMQDPEVMGKYGEYYNGEYMRAFAQF